MSFLAHGPSLETKSPRNVHKNSSESGPSNENVTFLEKMYYFYTAPITKFGHNTASYVILLFLFAVFIMTDLRPRAELNSPGTIEWIVIFWVGTLICEEIRQMSHGLKKWISEGWNQFDFIMYSMFLTSFYLRMVLLQSEFGLARLMYSLTFIAFCLRLLHTGFVFKAIGPRIILITKIMKDLRFFVFMLVLFVVSFGIAQEAILNPNVSPSFYLMLQPLYKPYWQLFGELGFEKGFGENSTCNGEASSMNTCFDNDKYRWVAPTLTAIYMLISNIILVNVFIAIFSVTLERAEDNAEAIWMYHRFGLLLEYLDRPTLAPPLIIINHVYRLILLLKRRVCKRAASDTRRDKESDLLRVEFETSDDEDLNRLQNKHSENYFNKKEKQQTDTTDKRLEKVQEKVDKMGKNVEMKMDNFEKKMQKMENNVAKILKILEN